MKKYITGFAAGACLALLAVNYFPEALPITQRDINNENIDALLWVQTSAEYRALCYQAYNSALERVRAAAESAKSGDKPLAVILDCDETVIDNLAVDASVFDTDASSGRLLPEWWKAAEALAMPGAEEFLNAVDALGVSIFYVTNRPESAKADTMRNMKALNFPQVDERHTVLTSSSRQKEARFSKIEEDYSVIVYLGDSAHDFPIGIYGRNMTERNAIADKNRELFGQKYIVFPNPVYGSWLGAFAENYGRMSPAEQHKAKLDALRIWKVNN
ncbi:MAG: 5'-nucleotidase, lipoprotein e(P4) family [Synergistaceae bacterium]|nr:5'-nucleotidase, lipoprotein e(P4) family [Synergistaceae bacterium]